MKENDYYSRITQVQTSLRSADRKLYVISFINSMIRQDSRELRESSELQQSMVHKLSPTDKVFAFIEAIEKYGT